MLQTDINQLSYYQDNEALIPIHREQVGFVQYSFLHLSLLKFVELSKF